MGGVSGQHGLLSPSTFHWLSLTFVSSTLSKREKFTVDPEMRLKRREGGIKRSRERDMPS